jgi:hypothetical protein
MLEGLTFGSAAALAQQHKEEEDRERARKREAQKQQKKVWSSVPRVPPLCGAWRRRGVRLVAVCVPRKHVPARA